MLDHFPGQRDLLLDLVFKSFIEFSRHQFGCRVVQKALEHTDPAGPRGPGIKEDLAKNFLGLVEDPHANHVVQKAFEVFKNDLPDGFIA
jgi:hypothetical protein